MIPAGILSQTNRDLSKEIWISWGWDFTSPLPQVPPVYCNVFKGQWEGPVTLKNALGLDTAYKYASYQGYEGGCDLNRSSLPTGPLDIINKMYISLASEDTWEEDYWGSIAISDIPPSSNFDLYILRHATSYVGNIVVSGLIPPTAIPSTTSASQTEMEVNDTDWTKISNITQPPFLATLNFSSSGGQGGMRAIVIKML